MRHNISTRTIAAVLLSWSVAQAATTPEQRCEAGKNDAAGKYAACIAKAQKSVISTGDAAKYGAALTKCEGKLVDTWDKLEAKAGTACPTTGDQSGIEDFMDACGQSVADALGGDVLGPDPVTCASDLSSCDGALTTCDGNYSSCTADLGTCTADLATCLAEPIARPLKTGKTACYSPGSTGSSIACTGTGQDGELQKGVARSFSDNGDGTITDNATGLMWEKHSNDNTIHDKDNSYTWVNAFARVATLNSLSFASHDDWRLPNLNELETLRNSGASDPALYPEFNNACAPSCTVLTCSCIDLVPSFWSSTSRTGNEVSAWVVSFFDGAVSFDVKTDAHRVRAVRGGS